jgi:hypothetical protein
VFKAPEKITTTKAKAKQVKDKDEVDVIVHQAESSKIFKMDDLLNDPRWTDIFLPSLTHALYVSRKPFKHFKAKAPEFLDIVQKIFDLSYPEIDLTLKTKDDLVKKVRSSMHQELVNSILTMNLGMPTREREESEACIGYSQGCGRVFQGTRIRKSPR